MKRRDRSLYLVSTLSCLWLFYPNTTTAQIIPDITLPSNSIAIPENNTIRIEGGTTAGSNLFHSFQEFSLTAGKEAFFNNGLDIQNIFSRVTGKNISNIDGVIRANGSANLFLINPNGIIFGPNAQLNIGGSFLGSTANTITFADGIEFSATNPSTPSLLSINVPVGLQLGPNPAQISVAGNGHDYTGSAPPPFWFPLRRTSNSNAGLWVQSGKTFALVGGDINLSGGIIAAPSGRIELASLKGGSVSINPNVSGWSLGYSGVQNYGDIQLTSRALLDVSGAGSGSIFVQTGSLRMRDSSLIVNQNFAPLPAGEIEIHAAGLVELSKPIGELGIETGIQSEGLAGPVANITISSQRLILSDGADLNSRNYSSAGGGKVTVNATESTAVIGTSPVYPSAVSSIQNFNLGSGQGGDMVLITGQLRLDGGAAIGSTTARTGNGGSVTIKATGGIEVIGFEPITLIPSNVNAATIGTGNAGNLTIEAASLTVRDGGRVEGSTLASAEAGSVTIKATDFVEISGKPSVSINPSLVASSATIQDEAIRKIAGLPDVPSGNAGNVTINTPVLRVLDGGLASVRNEGVGNAGTLAVNSNLVVLNNAGGLTAATASGGGGNINVQTSNIILRNGSSISTNAGSSNGGDITLNTQTLAALGNSDITANATGGFGGRVSIAAQGIFGTQFRESVTPESDITASSELGPQFSGTVEINTPDVDPSAGLVELPGDYVDASSSIATACTAKTGNRFTITGSSGLPLSPFDPLRGWYITTQVSSGKPVQGHRSGNSYSPQSPIVEATRWEINQKGELQLVANGSDLSAGTAWRRVAECGV
ncbi:filamentous hemagglutinin N-terminal domain-containing protein [Aerosakkonema funiforme]|uniref:two-partner secretion domain-containing protein n=1 Tax=Aerosakkonema funiforme TaxID=1246630 RepID=UPI0035B84970